LGTRWCAFTAFINGNLSACTYPIRPSVAHATVWQFEHGRSHSPRRPTDFTIRHDLRRMTAFSHLLVDASEAVPFHLEQPRCPAPAGIAVDAVPIPHGAVPADIPTDVPKYHTSSPSRVELGNIVECHKERPTTGMNLLPLAEHPKRQAHSNEQFAGGVVDFCSKLFISAPDDPRVAVRSDAQTTPNPKY